MSTVSSWTDTEVSVTLTRGAGGVTRVDGLLCAAPVWFRWDGHTLWQVGSGAAPVGEDRIRVRVDVGPGVAATVRSVAAAVVYAGRGAGTSWDTEIHVAEDASLDWRLEPSILTARANHRASTTVVAAPDAEVSLDEVLVLGREGEHGGTIRSTLAATVGDEPSLLTSLDNSVPGWAGPGGAGRAGVIAHRLQLGPDLGPVPPPADLGHRGRAACLEPAPGCRLAVALAGSVAGARAGVDAVTPG